ncbi:DUF4118 domain-containing protein [Romboutsia sp. 1001713B170207_170306_H8]|uniref:DUF4118 domain-containing protein n=1 Tax=Romboutsia sp. 1001713B170207_170306_H8 TaxID=2787112 RepID=UPI0008219A40|nr:DUF4118 domain-containing protein [Romboutsia sp. 1001713B170207_170306_H8]SCH98249.1 Sensor protein KdpD [uncultured Clostridium sp.]
MDLDDIYDSVTENSYAYKKNKPKKYILVINLLKIILIMSISTLIALFFKQIQLNESSIILVIILGVLFSSSITDGYLFGILSSILGVLIFNFFFTEPYYTFLAYRADYPITFFIMLISAIITSTLTSKIKREVEKSNLREYKIRLLYKNSKKLLKTKNKCEIIEVCNKSLVDILGKSVATSIIDSGGNLKKPVIYEFKEEDGHSLFQSPLEKCSFKESFILGKETGIGTDLYQDALIFNYPIKSNDNVLGVIGVACFNKKSLTENEKLLLKSICNQVIIAIEREDLYERTKQANLAVETERLRSNLLRSISHDLRTPLAGIMGSSSAMIENYESIDEVTKKDLLKNIYDDASWLTRSVENIISITKVDEGRLEIKKNLEVVEEIVAEAISIVEKYSKNHKINVDIPDEVIILNVDGLLIEQVLINIIDNAIRYTPDYSEIIVKVMKINDYVYFEVEDNGYGLKDEDIEYIFDRFYSKNNGRSLDKRGVGLGLSICKSIIEAHNGDIEAFNNSLGGATFRFKLPCGGGEE